MISCIIPLKVSMKIMKVQLGSSTFGKHWDEENLEKLEDLETFEKLEKVENIEIFFSLLIIVINKKEIYKNKYIVFSKMKK